MTVVIKAPNSYIENDLQIPTVKEEIISVSQKYQHRPQQQTPSREGRQGD